VWLFHLSMDRQLGEESNKMGKLTCSQDHDFAPLMASSCPAGIRRILRKVIMPPKGSKSAAKDTSGDGPSKKQKTGEKVTKADPQDCTHTEVIPAADALSVNRVQLYNGGQGILLGFRVPKDYFLATGAGDTNEVSVL